MLLQIFSDGLFAAIAAIGFAAISRPPRRAYLYCALIAAAGHSLRFVLMQPGVAGMHIVAATLIASFAVGFLAVLFSLPAHTPAETCLFPALLPMIPGMYAYRLFGGLVMCMLSTTPAAFDNYFYLFASNGLVCLFVLLAMATGATLPIFLLKKISFRATR